MTQFTDYLGNPINVGDLVIYPTASGSSSATINLAVVDAIDPIIDNPAGTGYIHESQVSKRDPTTVPYPTLTRREDGVWHRDKQPQLAYRLAIKKVRSGTKPWGVRPDENPDRKFYVTNVDRVVVVSDLAHAAYHAAKQAQQLAALEAA